MNTNYLDAVRLLLAVAPAVFRDPLFALKGGTAINLFVRDMPRLSVDLDLVIDGRGHERSSAGLSLGIGDKRAGLVAHVLRTPPRDARDTLEARERRAPEPIQPGEVRPAGD
jgi:hypothetical protein